MHCHTDYWYHTCILQLDSCLCLWKPGHFHRNAHHQQPWSKTPLMKESQKHYMTESHCLLLLCSHFVLAVWLRALQKENKIAHIGRITKIVCCIHILLGFLITVNQIYHWRWFKSHLSQAVRLSGGVLHDSCMIQIRSHVVQPGTFAGVFTYRALYQCTINKMSLSNPQQTRNWFAFRRHQTNRWVFITRACEQEYHLEYL